MEKNKVENVINIIKDMDIKDKLRLGICLSTSSWTNILYDKTKMYNIMFKAVSETLQELANDKKYLGAQIGFTSILHTWGQNLKDHPHIHCIVPAGGLDSLGKWRNRLYIVSHHLKMQIV